MKTTSVFQLRAYKKMFPALVALLMEWAPDQDGDET